MYEEREREVGEEGGGPITGSRFTTVCRLPLVIMIKVVDKISAMEAFIGSSVANQATVCAFINQQFTDSRISTPRGPLQTAA